LDAVAVSSAASSAVNGVGWDESIVGGVGEDHRQEFDDAGDGGVDVAEGVEVGDPLVDAERGDRVDGRASPAEQDVAAEHAAVVVDGAWVEVECGEPDGDPFGERGLAVGGVEPDVAALVDLDVVGVVLG
jgi:hypothetical protein